MKKPTSHHPQYIYPALLLVSFGAFYWVWMTMFYPKKPLCKDCNIVLITLDTCSAKNIPCYGYDRNTTPNLCAFAQKNQLFLNSYANATWTLPSHVSLLTGLLPSTHGVNEQWVDSLSPSLPFLPEVLQKNGYETVLFQEKNRGIFPDKGVYDRGISEILEKYDIKDIFEILGRNIVKNKKTFITYYNADCHEPNLMGSGKKLFTDDSYPGIPLQRTEYQMFSPDFYTYLMHKIPDELNKFAFGASTDSMKHLYEKMQLAASYDKSKAIFIDNIKTKMDKDIIGNLYWAYFYETFIDVNNKRQMNYLRALYDQQLYETDNSTIADFISKLNASPFKDNTIVIITSEHGQEFGEHGVFGHTTLYEGNMRVPFVLYIPGVSPHTITESVQGVDVMPTLLDLIGIKHAYSFDGLSLVPLLQNKHISSRILITDIVTESMRTLRNGDLKLFVKMNGKEWMPYELYNTKTDPSETHNLLESNMDMAKTMIKESNSQRVSRK